MGACRGVGGCIGSFLAVVEAGARAALFVLWLLAAFNNERALKMAQSRKIRYPSLFATLLRLGAKKQHDQ